MKNVTVTLPEETALWVRERAAEQNRSVSSWLADLVEQIRRREDASTRSRWRARSRDGRAGWNGLTNADRPGKNYMTGPRFVDPVAGKPPCAGVRVRGPRATLPAARSGTARPVSSSAGGGAASIAQPDSRLATDRPMLTMARRRLPGACC